MRCEGDHKQAESGCCPQIFTMKRRCPSGAARRSGCLRGYPSARGRRWATFLHRVVCGPAWPPSAQPPAPVRQGWATGLAAAAVAPAGLSQTEVVCHDMPKKVIPFPARKTSPPLPGTEEHSRITIHMGARRYFLNIPRPALAALPERATPKGRLEELQVQTRFLRLRAPAAVGDRIDGWRVCWVGGWDKGKVLFAVMVERVVRATSP